MSVHCDCGESYSDNTHFKCAACHHIFRRTGIVDQRDDTEEGSRSVCEHCIAHVLHGEFR